MPGSPPHGLNSPGDAPIMGVDALAARFPATRSLLGAAAMQSLLGRFLASLSGAADGASDPVAQWPGFIALSETGRACPAAHDLARLEVQVIRARETAAAPVATPAMFEARLAVPEGLADLRLGLHPAAGLIESIHPVGSLWQAAQRGDPMITPRAPHAEAVLITPAACGVAVQLLDAPAALLATAFFCRASLGEALGILIGEQPEADLSAALSTLVDSGMFTTLEG